jgi:hypothetical protein
MNISAVQPQNELSSLRYIVGLSSLSVQMMGQSFQKFLEKLKSSLCLIY